MTYAIAAAGTGGHVYPGLAVAEALVAAGVAAEDIVFFGGDRMEATTVPAAGYEFIRLDVQGLSRSLSLSNLKLPWVLRKAARRVSDELRGRRVRAVLAMGGYVTVPVGLAAKRSGVHLLVHEQNAHAGLANRLVARWAQRVFVSFPATKRLDGEVVGNPLRARFSSFTPSTLRSEAFAHYGLDPDVCTIGVFGGSLGALALNNAISTLAADWRGDHIQIVHLAGGIHEHATNTDSDGSKVTRRVVGFEERMELFYAAADLAVTRAGGSLFEVAATGTPAVVVPGAFGGGHQSENAQAMADAGAAIVLPETELDNLGSVIESLLGSEEQRAEMGRAALVAARPDAATVVAAAMMECGDV